MSLSKVYYDKKFSDLTITLIDDNKKDIIQVHKCILYSKNPYFENMLKDNFKESSESEITIKVLNIDAAKLVIESFYDINHTIDLDWKLQIDVYKCKDFFFQEKIFPQMKISEDEFEKFMDLIDSLGYPNDIVECIIKNLPENYDLEQFPTELLQLMYDLCDAYNIVKELMYDIVICNFKTSDKIIKSRMRYDYFIHYDYVPETNELIVLENEDKCENIMSMYKMNLEFKKISDITVNQSYRIPLGVKYMSDGKVLIHHDHKLEIYDSVKQSFVKHFTKNKEIDHFSYCDYLCHTAISYHGFIEVFDSSGNSINKYEKYNVKDIIISSNISVVIFRINNIIKIWNYLNNEIIKIKLKSYYTCKYKLSPNNKHLVVKVRDSVIVYDLISCEKIKKFKPNKGKDITDLDFKIGGELIVYCGKTTHIYDKEYNLINHIQNKHYVYNMKLIPGKDYQLAKKIHNILETRK
ncbi:BTB/POZ domain-containing protein [Acanthamoeba polyphaga moumouvirus]|uniref:BTB/POZ domain-containing protein n=1 Tax=Acanthamoeba polyphaga moumouvirus TaxID=1269028 RepID=L7RGT8_9VIRU|nr:BTB/POZ domain-containing protein [Acanthamoeba polyphaga moumouvirus]AGC02350.1 BTB/POZ domain-containing protein [Acanthamoeba polyphaga moumouvirus]